MKQQLIFVMVVWKDVSFRFGVFTTEKKAKQYLKDEIGVLKIWVEAIDDGNDKYYIKDELANHIDLSLSLKVINSKIQELLSDDMCSDFKITITKINPNSGFVI